MTDAAPHWLEGRILLARLALAFERLWAGLLWPMVCLGLAAIVVLSGVMTGLPALFRLAVLAALLAAFLISLRKLLPVRWPSRHEAMRRIEEKSALAHRPVTGLDDRLADGDEDSAQQTLWHEHRIRQLRRLGNLKVGAPRSIWRDLDATALRVPVTLGVLAAALLGSGDPLGNFVEAARIAPPAEARPLVLDAWLKPPAYTGKAPVVLTSQAMVEKLKADPRIVVPENAVLTLRLSGAKHPGLAFFTIDDNGGAGPEIASMLTSVKPEKSSFQAEAKIDRPVIVKVRDGGGELVAWQISVIRDLPPAVEIPELPVGDAAGALSAKWRANDDYGVTGIAAELSLADEQDDGLGFESNGIFLYEPPKFPVSVRNASSRAVEGTATVNLAEHPWAGFMVELELTAKDAAGHAAKSGPVRFRMPERLFVRPMAKALIEQRRHLILAPERSGQVVQMLEALSMYPEGLVEGSGPLIAIAAVGSRLRTAADQGDIESAVSMLWQIAVGIEDGSITNAKAELEALRRELERALAEGAPPERIAELMDKLRGAMDKYLQSLLEETRKRLEQGSLDPNQMQRGRPISQEDLQKMLDMIQKLAESGAKDAAREMLSELENLLRNLQPGMNAQQMAPQRDTPLGRMLDQLSELMRRQQGLMDDTQRMQPGEGGELQDQPGQEPGNRGQSLDPDALANEQQGLAQLLEQMLRELGKNGMNAPPSLGEAGKDMKGAEGSLRRQDREDALRQQGDAMARMREGAQGMARQLMQQGVGQEGNYGRHGEARGDDRDPLGRPMPHRGEDFGPDRDIVPSDLAIRRAREILETLRSRANEPELPPIDRDYIDRLLRGLY